MIEENINSELDKELSKQFLARENQMILTSLIKASIRYAADFHPEIIPSLNKVLEELLSI